MPGREILANPTTDLGDQLVVDRYAGLQHDEQDDAALAPPPLFDRDRFGEFGHVAQLAIDFRRADTDPPHLQGRVTASEDYDAAMCRELRPIAMSPSVRKALEIRVPVLGAVRIIPEADRHGRKGARDDEFASGAMERSAGFVKNLYAEAKRGPLDL